MKERHVIYGNKTPRCVIQVKKSVNYSKYMTYMRFQDAWIYISYAFIDMSQEDSYIYIYGGRCYSAITQFFVP